MPVTNSNNKSFIPVSVSRKNDAVISICQDNTTQMVVIEGVNPAAEMMLGYSQRDLAGKPLSIILTRDTSEDLDSYIEYQLGGNDVGAVLSRMRKFSVSSKEGVLLPIYLKVFTILSDDANHLRFELLMRDNSRKLLQDAIKDHTIIDEQTNLTTAASFTEVLTLIAEYKREHSLDAVLAIMEIDQFSDMETRYPPATVKSIIRNIAKRFADSSRLEDSMAHLSSSRLAILLFDCSTENAKVVLNRLRMTISSKPIIPEENKRISLTVSISYMGIRGDYSSSSMLQICSDILERNREDSGDRVYEGAN